ncbi:MAG: ArnT family glycosyltransferase [Thermoanaerobaculia bacterium]
MRGVEEGRRRSHRVWLALIIVTGLALRVLFAAYELDIERFEDEKYALTNVVGVVIQGSLRPVSAYYPSPVFILPPSALVAASNALHRATSIDGLLAIDEHGVSHPAAFLLCRFLMSVYGTLAVALVFLVGRRLFSSRVGLLAAGMLAFMPWMIFSSGNFKPDALLVMTVLLAFYLSLRSVADPRVSTYFLAGVAIALAASSKMTGLLVALPLTAATTMLWRQPRRWALLAAAGVTSFATFVLLNPYWLAYPWFVAGLRRDYAMRAARQEMTRDEMPGRLLDLMLGETGHGPLIGVLALAGLVGLTIRAARPGTASSERIALVMLLAFPPAYFTAYTVQTAYFKPNNFLPILPFTALAGAWLLAALWRWAGERISVLASRRAGRLAAVVVALVVVPPGAGYVYRSLVPSTEDMAGRLLHKRLAPAQGRSVILEPAARRGSIWTGRASYRLARLEVDRLDELPPVTLDMADAEVFAKRRLHGRAAAFYRGRMERLRPDQVRHFEPRLFRLRGPALVALIHRRTLLDEPQGLPIERCAAAPTCLEARLPPDMVAKERFSLEFFIPLHLAPRRGSLEPILVQGRPFDLLEIQRRYRRLRAATPRMFVDDPSQSVIRFTAQATSRSPVSIWLFRWAGGPRSAPQVQKAPPSPAPSRPQSR